MYKCLESRVTGVDDVNAEKVGILSAILSNFKCHWANHIYNCLEYYVVKADVKEGDDELSVNVGYSFMIAYLLKLNGVNLKAGSEVYPHTYLFRTTIKKSNKGSKSETTATEGSVSLNAPLSEVAEKAKRKRLRKKKFDSSVMPPLPAQPVEEFGLDCNEPLVKRPRKEVVEEPAIIVQEDVSTANQPVVLFTKVVVDPT